MSATSLPETITVWNSTGEDGFGGKTWSAPVTYPARIAHKQQKFTDINGDDRVSTAVCYSEGAGLSIGSMVYFGESVASEPVSDANDVRALSQTPSLAGSMRKAWFS